MYRIDAVANNARVKHAIRHPSIERFVPLALWVYNQFIKGHDFPTAIRQYLAVCHSINLAKISVHGRDGGEMLSANFLMRLVSGTWVRHETISEENIKKLKGMAEELKTATDGSSWYVPKLTSLAMAAKEKRATLQFCQGLQLPPESEGLYEQLRQQLGEIDSITQGLMAELHARRAYGIKPAYFQDGILHAPGDAWVFNEMPEEARGFNVLGLQNQFMSYVSLAPATSVRSTTLTYEEEGGQDHRVNLIKFPKGTRFVWRLDRNSELYIEPFVLTVRDILNDAGLELNYRLIQFATVLRLYDLTVPLKVVKQLPELPLQGRLRRLLGMRQNMSQLLQPNLVIPRIRWITGEASVVNDEFDQEHEADEQRTRLALRKHECIDHTRRLPKGHKASPQARARAAAVGIPLADDETFVQKHTRGTREVPTAMHKAVTR